MMKNKKISNKLHTMHTVNYLRFIASLRTASKVTPLKKVPYIFQVGVE